MLAYYSGLIRRVLALVSLSALLAGAAHADAANRPLRQLLPSLKGKVVLLDFWASWCEPCRHSFPWMGELQKRFDASDFVVVAVNMDQDRKLAEQFLSSTPAAFRVEYDPQGVLAMQFDVSAMPTSVLIDRRGQVRSKHRGFREAQRAERELAITNLLKE